MFIPPKIRNYFDLKAGDLLKFDIMEQRIVIKTINDLGLKSEKASGRMFMDFIFLLVCFLSVFKFRRIITYKIQRCSNNSSKETPVIQYTFKSGFLDRVM